MDHLTSNSRRLANRVAVITGGSRGIGKAIALRYIQEGARVIIINRSPESGKQTADELNTLSPDSCYYYTGDVSQYDEMQALAQKISQDHGQIDILVNSAGIGEACLLFDLQESNWDAVINVNLKGVFNVTKAFQLQLMTSSCGRIINLASTSAIKTWPGQTHYAASKSGVVAFTKNIMHEFAPFKVTCNCLAPGLVLTDLADPLPEAMKQQFLQNTPLGQFATAEEIAACAAFLASDEARSITGQVLVCDGGMSV